MKECSVNGIRIMILMDAIFSGVAHEKSGPIYDNILLRSILLYALNCTLLFRSIYIVSLSFQVMKDLLQKDSEFWLEQLARLGLFERVEELAQMTKESGAVIASTGPEPDSPPVEIPRQAVADPLSDSWSIEADVVYRWRDWRVVKSRDSLFIWCDACALELRFVRYSLLIKQSINQ